MKLNDFIKEYKPVLTDSLHQYLEKRITEYEHVAFFKDTLIRLLSFSSSGKMLRGLFILLIFSFFEKLTPSSRVLNAALAMELMQSALLIHDDIIDNDQLRRGKKTIFSQYLEYGSKKKYDQPSHFGRSMGMCVGDIAFFLAYDLLSYSSDKAEILVRISRLFAREIHLVIVGEMIDVDMATSSIEPNLEQIIDMYKYKTARYSFSLPFAAGALLGGASVEQINKLVQLGEIIGILFQIQDDWLGLYGTESETGKPIGSDLRENKKTVYRSLLFASLSTDEKKSIPLLSVQDILDLMKKYDIEKKIDAYKTNYENQSKELIKTLSFTSLQKEVLLEVSELVTKRKN